MLLLGLFFYSYSSGLAQGPGMYTPESKRTGCGSAKKQGRML